MGTGGSTIDSVLAKSFVDEIGPVRRTTVRSTTLSVTLYLIVVLWDRLENTTEGTFVQYQEEFTLQGKETSSSQKGSCQS